MDKFIDKLSSYNLLNNLIPGGGFSYLLQHIYSIDILGSSVVENFFIYYFVGMFLNRLGSIVIEPLAKKVKFVSYSDYHDYVVASKMDNKIDVLLETNNLYRTIATSGLLIIVIKIYTYAEQYISWLSCATPYIAASTLTLVFLFSYKKQTKYLKDRVDIILQYKHKQEEENRNESDGKIL